MHDQPDIDDLLAAAHESLLGTVLPATPEALRHEVLMIGNALAIARRALASGEAPLRSELRALAAIYAEQAPPGLTGGELGRALEHYTARLAADIRRGAFDPPHPQRAAVQAALKSNLVRRLREARPKFLASAGVDA